MVSPRQAPFILPNDTGTLLVQAHEALRVSLDDLRAAETKGKWWLVGAAWGGDPLVDQQRAPSIRQHEAEAEDIGNTALVKLARKQGMNTDIRRSIFVVLMSSDVRGVLSMSGDPCLKFDILGLSGRLRAIGAAQPVRGTTARDRPCHSSLLW